MYRLMIVDDEESIRQGMAKSVPWSEWGFEVTALCANGQEAVQEIERNPPDVVLSDVRMPKMDGLELMQWLNQNHPEIKIVILSGYSDFEYLNMSIKNKVTEYLLKPTDLDEFEEVFRRMKTVMDKEQQTRKQQNKKDQLLFFAWLDKLLRGRNTTAETEMFVDKAEEYNVFLENSAVIVLNLDQKDNDPNTLIHTKNQLAQLASQQGAVQFFVSSEDAVTGIYGTDVDSDLDYKELFAWIKTVQQQVRSQMGVSISAGISELCTEMQMLPQAYEQAKCCAQQNVFCGSESIFRYSQLEEEIPQREAYFRTEQIEQALLNQQNQQITDELQRVFSLFHQHPLKEYRYIDQLCLSCLFELSRWALQYNVRAEKVLHRSAIAYSDIYSCHSLDAKCIFMTNVLDCLQQELEKQRSSNRKSSSVAYQVRQIVDRDFDNNLMSLEYVAGKVHKSPAYISKVFKNELNCNFSDYITRRRMEHAAELLSHIDHPKIYEIAAQCGYADVSNFIKVFRKYHNESPNEYRSTLLRRGS